MAADLDRVAEIERDTFPDPWSRRAFEESLSHDAVEGLAQDDEGGRLIGYGLCARAADEGEILNLAVAARARGQGAGRRLMEAMLEGLRAAGVARVFLEVRRSNEAAIGLYQRLGFVTLGMRRGYYTRPREDALTMVLECDVEHGKKMIR